MGSYSTAIEKKTIGENGLLEPVPVFLEEIAWSVWQIEKSKIDAMKEGKSGLNFMFYMYDQ